MFCVNIFVRIEEGGLMDKIQWHPAFCGATEWELKDNKDDLIFDNEYYLGKTPLRMDMLVIKKQHNVGIINEIGKIFKDHNVIEFKGEGDSLSIDDFYKGLGYACIYKSKGKVVNEYPDDEITVTFMRSAYPRELFKMLIEKGMKVTKKYPGIFYIDGETLFPCQVIVTSRLDRYKHPGLRILTSGAKEQDIRKFVIDAQGAKDPGDLENIDAVLQVSVSANSKLYEKVRGDDLMCQALRELMKDEIDKEKKDTKIEDLRNIMKNLKLTAEQAMDALGISPDARNTYIGLL